MPTLGAAYLQKCEGRHHARQENSHNSVKNLSLNSEAFPAWEDFDFTANVIHSVCVSVVDYTYDQMYVYV